MPERICSVLECGRPLVARGFCDGHYRRWKKGDLRPGEPLQDFSGTIPRLCEVDGCDRKHYAGGLCEGHYARKRRGFSGLMRPVADKVSPGTYGSCSVADCDAMYYGNGLCRFHYNQAARDQWTEEQREAKRLRQAEARRANPVPSRLSTAKCDARRRAAHSLEFSTAELIQRLSMWGGRCWICGDAATAIDHVKPIAKGGWHALSNLRPACASCNTRKSAKWPLAPAVLDAIRQGRAFAGKAPDTEN